MSIAGSPSTPFPSASRLGLGLAALGRPAYITLGRDEDLGEPTGRGVDAMRATTHRMLDAAWLGGIRFFDTARSYGRAEEFLGGWLAQHPDRRDELTIESKWGYRYVADWAMDADVNEVKDHSLAAFEAQWPDTLTALGAEPDVYLIHSLTPDSPALGDAALLNALRALRDDHGIRIGISTSGPDQGAVLDAARTLADSPFSAVQATWNLLETSAAAALGRANDAGWLIVVKESLANGRLGPRGEAGGILAERLGRSADQAAIGAALAQPWADIVLVGAVTPAQLVSNLAARPLDADALETIADLVQPSAEYWGQRSALGWG